MTASIHGHKTLSNLPEAVRSMEVTVNVYSKELLSDHPNSYHDIRFIHHVHALFKL